MFAAAPSAGTCQAGPPDAKLQRNLSVSLSWPVCPDSITSNFPHRIIIVPLSFPGKCTFSQAGYIFPHLLFLSRVDYVMDCDKYREPSTYCKAIYTHSPGLCTIILQGYFSYKNVSMILQRIV